jgi:hypothetical protein
VRLGLLMVYSTTGGAARGTGSTLYVKQLYAHRLRASPHRRLAIDYRRLAERAHILYIGRGPAAVYVLFFGIVVAARGAGSRSASSICSRRSSPSWQ